MEGGPQGGRLVSIREDRLLKVKVYYVGCATSKVVLYLFNLPISLLPVKLLAIGITSFKVSLKYLCRPWEAGDIWCPWQV